MSRVVSKTLSIALITAVLFICCGKDPVGNGGNGGNGDNGDDEPDWEDDIGVIWQLTSLPGNETYPAWAPDGSKIAFAWDGEGDTDIYITSVDNRTTTRLTYGGGTTPCWSLDGSLIVFASADNYDFHQSNIYVVDVTGGEPRFITNGLRGAFDPFWHPDMSQITFVSMVSGYPSDELAIYNIDYPDGEPVIFESPPNFSTYTEPVWSPDGSKLAFHYCVLYDEYGWIGEHELYADGTWIHLETTPYPTWSPDGKKIAFSDRVGEHWENYTDIFVYPLPGGGKIRVTDSTYKAITPAWSPNGSRIAFANKIDENGDYDIWIVELNE